MVLTSHDMFRMNVTTLCAFDWECVIVDEAHRLKNERSQLYKACVKLRTKRRYGLTGTIMQNKYIELFNVFDWASPNSLGPREHFLEYYGEPLKQGQRISAPERFVQIAQERKQHLVQNPLALIMYLFPLMFELKIFQFAYTAALKVKHSHID